MTATTPDRDLPRLMAAYAAVVLLLVLVSARLWWQSPLHLIQYEFDYFLGLFASPDPTLFAAWLSIGRRLHLFGFVLVGALYLVVLKRLLASPAAMQTRQIVAWSAVVSLFFAIGMPWVSPDVFFYIGSGWIESHYGLSPYLTPFTSVPGFAHEQMFANIFPGFLSGVTSYGPLFQKLAAGVAWLSGGNDKAALALYKVLGLALHAGCSAIVWRLAPADSKRFALFAYAANPLICFSVLTCAHNDHWMNLFVLLALLAVTQRRWSWAGAALGAAFGFKYFPLVFVPVFGLAALMQPRADGGKVSNVFDAVRLAMSFIVAVALCYLPYPEALRAFADAAVSGIPVYRNSIYFFLDVFSAYLGPNLLGTQAFGVSHQGQLGMFLKGAYAVSYALMLLALSRRLRSDPLRGVAEGCLVATLLYFILVNTGNQEWYLTWLIGPALVLPYARARSLAWWLSAGFLPLVIFTVKNPMPIWFIANVVLYGLVLVLGGRYLAGLARTTWSARGLAITSPGAMSDRPG